MELDIATATAAHRTAPEQLRCDILENFLTQVELAGLLDRHPRTLKRWDALRIGPPRIKIGRTILHKRQAVLAWIEAREQQRRRG